MSTLPQAERSGGLLCEIVLTGGPAGGKSASLDFLGASLASRGYRVIVCPEVATTYWTHGIPDVGTLASDKRDIYRQVQRSIASMQRRMREEYHRLAEAFDEPVIVIYDRGELDCAAYLTEEEFAQNLEEMGVSEQEILDSYDAVIHLRTAAGTPFGNLFNNPGRREADPEAAKEADRKTLRAWSNHPHLYVVDSADTFDVKLAHLFTAIADTISRCSDRVTLPPA